MYGVRPKTYTILFIHLRRINNSFIFVEAFNPLPNAISAQNCTAEPREPNATSARSDQEGRQRRAKLSKNITLAERV